MKSLNKAMFMALGLFAFATLLVVASPSKSVEAQIPDVFPALHVSKVCDGAVGPFNVTVDAEPGEINGVPVTVSQIDTVTFPIDCDETVTVCLDFDLIIVPIPEFDAALVPAEECDELLDLGDPLSFFLGGGELVVTEEPVENVEVTFGEDCAPDGSVSGAQFQVGRIIGAGELDCVITNTEVLSDLTVTKLCPIGSGDATFNIAFGGTSSVFGCGTTITEPDLEPGDTPITEVIGGTDAANFETIIACDDGTFEEGTTATVELVGDDVTCRVINIFTGGEELTPEEIAQILSQLNLDLELEIEIENELNNINENVNDNDNDNTNNNVSDNTQNQTNEQNTNVTTGDVNVSSEGGSGTGSGGGSGGHGHGDHHDKPRIVAPNTGSAGLADNGTGFGVFAAVVGLLSLAAFRFAGTRS